MSNLNNEINISDYAENSYLEYALSVVKGRAIPFIEDGLKPVHRRIFYSMHKMGISDTSVPKKCARVTGDVIGKYHPHGDIAVYEALVFQTQKFRIRYPVAEGIGNFGSRDGDGAAAQRYTECKFHPISKLMLDELDQEAVDFIPNYDGNETEPRVLPAKLPFILLNATEGIGVGMATHIPSHNLKEVVSAIISYLNNDEITLPEILNHIKGPDFPTGGILISSKAEIEKVYAEGRGAFRLRSKYYIEDEGTKNWKLVFTEIPYEISVKNVMEEIDAIFNPEDKAKKDAKGKEKKITPEQLRMKQLFISLIDKYNDGSDKHNPVRLVVEPKSHKQDPHELAAILLSSTSLECNFSANFVIIGRDGRPVQKTLMEIIYEWSSFRLETIERRCRFHLNKINNRLHILDGRKIVLNNIDDVIQIIKTSKDPKTDLMNKYLLSEIQAQDVLDLRLRQLGNLELESIEKEVKGLLIKKAELEKILSSEKTLKKQMIKELTEDMEKFGDERLTEVRESQKTDMSLLQEKTTKIAEEDITLAISQKGWIKTVKGAKEANEIQFKEGDTVDYIFKCKNTDTICIFDITGQAYNASITDLGKDGAPINTLATIGAKVALVCPIHKDKKYLLTQSSGFGFIVASDNLFTRQKAGKEMITIVDNGQIFQPIELKDEDLTTGKLGLITTENKFLTYALSDISVIGKGKGVALMGLPEGHSIKDLKIINDNKVIFKIDGKKEKKSITLEKEEFQKFVKNRSASAKGAFIPVKDKASNISFLNEVLENKEDQ